MEFFIKGKFTKVIYRNEESNYVVALFKVQETNDENIEVGKSINVNGIITDVKIDAKYILYGSFIKHVKYSWQFAFNRYELEKIEGKDAIYEFLKSSFVEGCGEATAKKIVDIYGDKALDKIKENVNNLLLIKGMTSLKAMKIYNSIISYEKDDHIILKLKEYGFSIDDASRIMNKHLNDIDLILEGNFYLLKDIFDFKKIDDLYIQNFDKNNSLRVKECILNSMMQISFNEGSTYYYIDEIIRALNVLFNINLSSDEYMDYLQQLASDAEIVVDNKRFYLTKYYLEEKSIASDLYDIANDEIKNIKDIDKKIDEIEKKINIKYNDEQKKAIKEALINKISIISGGPGTGKTTIIKAIVELYMNENNLTNKNAFEKIALLAPTGRASKKLSMATGLPAYTIHRFLKWHKESDCFEFDEYNKITQDFIIVDESSMIDVSLAKALLCALKKSSKIVFVGDIYQLPSVGPGLFLEDLINSDYFTFTPLNIIYRQSENSYIPFLAKDIKMQNIDDEFLYKRDDYNFIICDENELLSKIIATVKYAISKGLNDNNLQILAPMYKGINGIDNLNIKLQELFNPKDNNKNEISYGEKIYRENDKVLQLINDSDNGVFNGDIGKIISIFTNLHKKTIIRIDFDGNLVDYEKKDLKNITHAYAITIHKSQGSEFEHVIMPICKNYFIMLYNKLLYTGVSRAKKSLTIIGDPRSFTQGIANNYSKERKTSLKEYLLNKFNA